MRALAERTRDIAHDCVDEVASDPKVLAKVSSFGERGQTYFVYATTPHPRSKDIFDSAQQRTSNSIQSLWSAGGEQRILVPSQRKPVPQVLTTVLSATSNIHLYTYGDILGRGCSIIMIKLLRQAVLLSCVHGSLATHTRTVEAPTATSAATLSTCPNRTINHITHTLAQQCLKSDRAPQDAAQVSTGPADDDTASTAVSITSEVTVITLTQTIRPPVDTVSVKVSVVQDGDEPTAEATPSVAIPGPDKELPKPSPPEVEEDVESPLDNVNFLSFEEWKKQNLAKVGQSPEDIGRGQPIDTNRPRPGINNALDTLGEEQEISLDFAGFGGGAQVPVAESHPSRGVVRPSASVVDGEHDLEASSLRSKDAGKTCKERSNYASFDCAATILKSNKECQHASSVLVENKDSYMLNTCSVENKFFIVQLCDDIQIDTIVLANYEFFSSSFRHFRISVSDRYPVKMDKWRDLGTFEGRNTREIQAFLVQNPLIWARYLRIEFLSHYGTEYYCPVSVLRVHGTTMWEDYRHQEELARGEEEEATLEVEALATPPVPLAAVEPIDEAVKATAQVTLGEESPAPVTATASLVVNTPESSVTNSPSTSDAALEISQTVSDEESPAMNVTETTTMAEVTSKPNMTSADVPAKATDDASTVVQESSQAELSASMGTTKMTDDVTMVQNASTSSSLPTANATTPVPTALETGSESSQNASETTVLPTTGNAPAANESVAISASQNTTLTTNATRAIASPTTSQPPQPSTQESFFKSFHKRLQQLESNSTWSLQYIEEQSRILRDAFTKVEKRQLATTTKFLSQLNSTVMTELHGFRQSYDQLWQSTVIELEGQREAYQREMLALSTRLTMVADELVWQKRMGIVQSTLLLLCLALAIFTRSENGFLEVPLMQQMMNRSTTALRGGWESPPNSPSPDSRSPVSLFRRKLWRPSTDPDRSASDTEMSRPQSRDKPDINVEPPSPNAGFEQGDYFDGQDDARGPPSKPGSPKKQRKKAKKPQGPPHNPGRAKSPLAL